MGRKRISKGWCCQKDRCARLSSVIPGTASFQFTTTMERNFVEIGLENHQVRCLVDSGASFSCISQHQLKTVSVSGSVTSHYSCHFTGPIRLSTSLPVDCVVNKEGEYGILSYRLLYLCNDDGTSTEAVRWCIEFSQNNHRVVVVSPDGKTCKTILSEADRIEDPWTIDIDRESEL
ncbi:unnamed protein product [Mytilus edulis]|uniref:Uncharacterized protein n=1 Tax=Mytilus edulis TaxID=6550 RepID=A0A8S3TVA6_MYTED|nr:unnamed protein product [Mytilus edulis]